MHAPHLLGILCESGGHFDYCSPTRLRGMSVLLMHSNGNTCKSHCIERIHCLSWAIHIPLLCVPNGQRLRHAMGCPASPLFISPHHLPFSTFNLGSHAPILLNELPQIQEVELFQVNLKHVSTIISFFREGLVSPTYHAQRGKFSFLLSQTLNLLIYACL